MSLEIDFTKVDRVGRTFTVKSIGKDLRFWFETFGVGSVCVVTLDNTYTASKTCVIFEVMDKCGMWHSRVSGDCYFLLEHDLGFRIKFNDELIINAF